MRKGVVYLILAAFIAQTCVPYAHAQQAVSLPNAGIRLELSPAFAPPLLKGVKVYMQDPFRLDFILDRGDSAAAKAPEGTNFVAKRLIKYFLAALTVPEEDLWVNLSPYEKDRIVPEAFGQTEMGRDLLAQDYILKQVTASLLYPEGEAGKEFWAKIYAQAQEKFGTADIPVDTFNKVWIVPEKATVYENNDAAFVVESRLKVMLESDYTALLNNPLPTGGHVAPQGNVSPSRLPSDQPLDSKAPQGSTESQALAKDVLRTVIIPILEKEINEGKNFAQLRQVYYSLILATWFKDRIKQTILGQTYTDQKKILGVDIADKAEKEKIWAQYVEAFKKGVFNFVKEEQDAASGETIHRKYFSGGAGLQIKAKGVFLVKDGVFHQPKDFFVDHAEIIEFKGQPFDAAQSADGSMHVFTDEERAQIKHTFAYLQRTARELKDEIGKQGLERSFQLFQRWLRENVHKTDAQIRQEPEKISDLVEIFSGIVKGLYAVADVLAVVEKEGQGLVTFNKAGQMRVDTNGVAEDLFYDLHDKLNKLNFIFVMILDWLSIDIAKDDREIMVMVRKMQSRLRYSYRGYLDMLEDILQPERIKGIKLDIKMDFSRESKGLPERIYAHFLLPALPVIMDAAQAADDEQVDLNSFVRKGAGFLEGKNFIDVPELVPELDFFQPEKDVKEDYDLLKSYKLQKFYAWLGSSRMAGFAGKKVVYNPFGGMDVVTPFSLAADATDVVSVGIESFGSPEVVLAHLRRLTNPEQVSSREQDFDEGHAYSELEEQYGGIGALALSRIVRFLGGTITGVHYFDLDQEGKLHFAVQAENGQSQQAVVEFTVKDTDGVLVTKRFWYIQQDLLGEGSYRYNSFRKFISALDFDALMIKAAYSFWSDKNERIGVAQVTLDPARQKDVVVLCDQQLTVRNVSQDIWKEEPNVYTLQEGESFGYSSEPLIDKIYYGPSSLLKSSKDYSQNIEFNSDPFDAAQVSDDENILRAAEELFFDPAGTARAVALLDRSRGQLKALLGDNIAPYFWRLADSTRIVVSANAPVFAMTLVDGKFQRSPVIVLNGSAVKEMSDVQLLYLLGHELGHLVFDEVHVMAQKALREKGDLDQNRFLLSEIEKRSDLLGLALAMDVFGAGSLGEIAQVPLLRKKYQADIARLQKKYDLDRPVIFDPHMQDEARAQWLGEMIDQYKKMSLSGQARKALVDNFLTWAQDTGIVQSQKTDQMQTAEEEQRERIEKKQDALLAHAQELARRFPQYSWIKWESAARVVWPELVRVVIPQEVDGPVYEHGQFGSLENRWNYWANQIEVRQVFLDMIAAFLDGNDEVDIVSSLSEAHRFLIMGKDGLSEYYPPTTGGSWSSLGEISGIKELFPPAVERLKGHLRELVLGLRTQQAGFSGDPLIEELFLLYEEIMWMHKPDVPWMKEPGLYTYGSLTASFGNHAFAMNLINTLLRLTYAQGIPNGLFDITLFLTADRKAGLKRFSEIFRDAGFVNEASVVEKDAFPGGIDLNSKNGPFNVKSAGSGVQFNFDPAVTQRFQNAAGINPVIINIQPMTMSLPTFLGISDNVPAQEMVLR